ncbi:cell wall anchor protein [Micromonospora sp. RTP1Z1]|uniref:cell wall anchor protein n=1 Tax=Micromonospora sp. RTP1Z1 TaxID=2994043 RepID=UPI0029C7B139|nr:cell wall anchor protein [Micromonospora sp. RTP1Z1]
MNRPNFRRVAAVAAGALIGLAGVATFAAPAMAHHPQPSGTYCAAQDGKVTVNWSVGSNVPDITGTITKVESTVPGDITGNLAVGATLETESGTPLTGTQTHTFEGAIPELKLNVEARWVRGDQIITTSQSVVAQPSRDCGPAESPSPSPSSPSPSATPEPTKSPEATPSPSASSPASPSATPSVPAEPAEPAEPIFQLDQTCDKMTFSVENPAKGIPFTATMTTEKGVTKKLVSVPGKTVSVSFDAYKGLKVTVKYDVVEDSETIPYTQPKDCSGQGGGLPVTGPAAGAIVGGAAVLLAAGAVLFVMARRRRVRFTA